MFGSLLRKLIPKNIAGILGLVQSIVNTLRELLMLIVRLLAIFMPGKFNEGLIVKIASSHGWIDKGLKKIVDFFLKVGE